MTTNAALFESSLTEAYRTLFKTNPDYGYTASRISPEKLAAKMTIGLANGSANKDGYGIKQVCKLLGIKHTYKAIKEYLTSP